MMAETKKCVIYLSKEHDFTHTIENNSETLGEIYLIRRTRRASYENHDLRDVVFNEETQTLVTFMIDKQGRHAFTGRILILKLTVTSLMSKLLVCQLQRKMKPPIKL